MERIKGILRMGENGPYLEDNKIRFLEGKNIWEGYLTHWLNKPVRARFLPQKDYETKKPILILWPDTPPPVRPFVDVYYNERLIKYPASLFGHNAINVNVDIFNFSHLINENEVMDIAEYMYRPALGEFAPSPNNDKFEILPDGKAYLDKFGRNFMRTIHVLRIEGMDVEKLSAIYRNQLNIIHNSPVKPIQPEKYQGFSFFSRSCTTIIRDGLKEYGFSGFGGNLPRDFFISLSYVIFNRQDEWGIRAKFISMPQLIVPEAPKSTMTPLINPVNWMKQKKLRHMV